MECKNCGTKLPNNAKFCYNCGASTGETDPAEAQSAPAPRIPELRQPQSKEAAAEARTPEDKDAAHSKSAAKPKRSTRRSRRKGKKPASGATAADGLNEGLRRETAEETEAFVAKIEAELDAMPDGLATGTEMPAPDLADAISIAHSIDDDSLDGDLVDAELNDDAFEELELLNGEASGSPDTQTAESPSAARVSHGTGDTRASSPESTQAAFVSGAYGATPDRPYSHSEDSRSDKSHRRRGKKSRKRHRKYVDTATGSASAEQTSAAEQGETAEIFADAEGRPGPPSEQTPEVFAGTKAAAEHANDASEFRIRATNVHDPEKADAVPVEKGLEASIEKEEVDPMSANEISEPIADADLTGADVSASAFEAAEIFDRAKEAGELPEVPAAEAAKVVEEAEEAGIVPDAPAAEAAEVFEEAEEAGIVPDAPAAEAAEVFEEAEEAGIVPTAPAAEAAEVFEEAEEAGIVPTAPAAEAAEVFEEAEEIGETLQDAVLNTLDEHLSAAEAADVFMEAEDAANLSEAPAAEAAEILAQADRTAQIRTSVDISSALPERREQIERVEEAEELPALADADEAVVPIDNTPESTADVLISETIPVAAGDPYASLAEDAAIQDIDIAPADTDAETGNPESVSMEQPLEKDDAAAAVPEPADPSIHSIESHSTLVSDDDLTDTLTAYAESTPGVLSEQDEPRSDEEVLIGVTAPDVAADTAAQTGAEIISAEVQLTADSADGLPAPDVQQTVIYDGLDVQPSAADKASSEEIASELEEYAGDAPPVLPVSGDAADDKELPPPVMEETLIYDGLGADNVESMDGSSTDDGGIEEALDFLLATAEEMPNAGEIAGISAEDGAAEPAPEVPIGDSEDLFQHAGDAAPEAAIETQEVPAPELEKMTAETSEPPTAEPEKAAAQVLQADDDSPSPGVLDGTFGAAADAAAPPEGAVLDEALNFLLEKAEDMPEAAADESAVSAFDLETSAKAPGTSAEDFAPEDQLDLVAEQAELPAVGALDETTPQMDEEPGAPAPERTEIGNLDRTITTTSEATQASAESFASPTDMGLEAPEDLSIAAGIGSAATELAESADTVSEAGEPQDGSRNGPVPADISLTQNITVTSAEEQSAKAAEEVAGPELEPAQPAGEDTHKPLEAAVSAGRAQPLEPSAFDDAGESSQEIPAAPDAAGTGLEAAQPAADAEELSTTAAGPMSAPAASEPDTAAASVSVTGNVVADESASDPSTERPAEDSGAPAAARTDAEAVADVSALAAEPDTLTAYEPAQALFAAGEVQLETAGQISGEAAAALPDTPQISADLNAAAVSSSKDIEVITPEDTAASAPEVPPVQTPPEPEEEPAEASLSGLEPASELTLPANPDDVSLQKSVDLHVAAPASESEIESSVSPAGIEAAEVAESSSGFAPEDESGNIQLQKNVDLHITAPADAPPIDGVLPRANSDMADAADLVDISAAEPATLLESENAAGAEGPEEVSIDEELAAIPAAEGEPAAVHTERVPAAETDISSPAAAPPREPDDIRLQENLNLHATAPADTAEMESVLPSADTGTADAVELTGMSASDDAVQLDAEEPAAAEQSEEISIEEESGEGEPDAALPAPVPPVETETPSSAPSSEPDDIKLQEPLDLRADAPAGASETRADLSLADTDVGDALEPMGIPASDPGVLPNAPESEEVSIEEEQAKEAPEVPSAEEPAATLPDLETAAETEMPSPAVTPRAEPDDITLQKNIDLHITSQDDVSENQITPPSARPEGSDAAEPRDLSATTRETDPASLTLEQNLDLHITAPASASQTEGFVSPVGSSAVDAAEPRDVTAPGELEEPSVVDTSSEAPAAAESVEQEVVAEDVPEILKTADALDGPGDMSSQQNLDLYAAAPAGFSEAETVPPDESDTVAAVETTGIFASDDAALPAGAEPSAAEEPEVVSAETPASAEDTEQESVTGEPTEAVSEIPGAAAAIGQELPVESAAVAPLPETGASVEESAPPVSLEPESAPEKTAADVPPSPPPESPPEKQAPEAPESSPPPVIPKESDAAAIAKGADTAPPDVSPPGPDIELEKNINITVDAPSEQDAMQSTEPASEAKAENPLGEASDAKTVPGPSVDLEKNISITVDTPSEQDAMQNAEPASDTEAVNPLEEASDANAVPGTSIELEKNVNLELDEGLPLDAAAESPQIAEAAAEQNLERTLNDAAQAAGLVPKAAAEEMGIAANAAAASLGGITDTSMAEENTRTDEQMAADAGAPAAEAADTSEKEGTSAPEPEQPADNAEPISSDKASDAAEERSEDADDTTKKRKKRERKERPPRERRSFAETGQGILNTLRSLHAKWILLICGIILAGAGGLVAYGMSGASEPTIANAVTTALSGGGTSGMGDVTSAKTAMYVGIPVLAGSLIALLRALMIFFEQRSTAVPAQDAVQATAERADGDGSGGDGAYGTGGNGDGGGNHEPEGQRPRFWTMPVIILVALCGVAAVALPMLIHSRTASALEGHWAVDVAKNASARDRFVLMDSAPRALELGEAPDRISTAYYEFDGAEDVRKYRLEEPNGYSYDWYLLYPYTEGDVSAPAAALRPASMNSMEMKIPTPEEEVDAQFKRMSAAEWHQFYVAQEAPMPEATFDLTTPPADASGAEAPAGYSFTPYSFSPDGAEMPAATEPPELTPPPDAALPVQPGQGLDVTGDGSPDELTVANDGQTVTLVLNGTSFPLAFAPAADVPYQVYAIDADPNDGLREIVVQGLHDGYSSARVYRYINGQLQTVTASYAVPFGVLMEGGQPEDVSNILFDDKSYLIVPGDGSIMFPVGNSGGALRMVFTDTLRLEQQDVAVDGAAAPDDQVAAPAPDAAAPAEPVVPAPDPVADEQPPA